MAQCCQGGRHNIFSFLQKVPSSTQMLLYAPGTTYTMTPNCTGRLIVRDIHLYAVVWLVNPFRTVHISTGYILPILYNCTVQYSSFHLRGPNFNNCQNKQYSTVQKLSIWGKTGWYAKWIIPFNWNSYMHCTNTLLQMYTLTPYICTLCTR